MHILMVAAENGALPGGKVGGIGDVIRDAPRALAAAGHRVTVITPGYGRLSRLPGARFKHTQTVDFRGALEEVSLFEAEPPREENPSVSVGHWLVEHPLFAACGEGNIYCHDEWEPFATDANKFALFCNAVCHALAAGAFGAVDVVHLHDWHAAPVLFLRRYRFSRLQGMRAVYSIHNLSIQGVRSFAGNQSSLEAWFSITDYEKIAIRHPAAPDCVNLMRMGINLADAVHVVSPTYAREILKPSDPATGFIGGEGLQGDLKKRARKGRLAGILNGCDYPRNPPGKASKEAFIELANKGLLDWVGEEPYISTAYFFAQQRLMTWSQRRERDSHVVASISRLTAQKVSLLAEETAPGTSALEALLQELKGGMYILLGNGDSHYETFLSGVMAHHDNFIFLKGYSDALADSLYRLCDLFLMPSSFEPCGISQMLAMRAGKPCLVHKVGGLADTVQNGVTGFSFTGRTPAEQARRMVKTFRRMLAMRERRPDQWRKMVQAALAARFSWDQSVARYVEKLYKE